jgi:hypothetical protein
VIFTARAGLPRPERRPAEAVDVILVEIAGIGQGFGVGHAVFLDNFELKLGPDDDRVELERKVG